MRIGKPQSKRVPVRLRHKIQKASASKERKRRKEAKSNPQWRSRLKKDPGIPNLFPYKAKVLAELEESKRKKEEEALRKREIAKAQRLGKAVASDVVRTAEDEDGDAQIEDAEAFADEDSEMEEDDDANPMAALLASAQARANAYTGEDEDEDQDDGDDDEFEGFEDTQPQRKGLPKVAINEPIKGVTKLIERVQDSSGGIQILLDHYEIPPLVTVSSDVATSFLIEVARKRGRLGRGGVPNLHSAALTVLTDVNEERLLLPSLKTKPASLGGKGDVEIVQQMAAPFTIEGLWEDVVDELVEGKMVEV